MHTNDLMKIVDETKKLTTIVLEDDPETNEWMSETLENFFNKVYPAYEGEEALKLYKKHQPDIVYIDIILPGMSGLEVAKQIREMNPKQTIVIVSGSDDMSHISRSVELDVNNFIRKPINADKMIDVLNDIVHDIKYEKKLLKRILKKKVKKFKKELKKELEI